MIGTAAVAGPEKLHHCSRMRPDFDGLKILNELLLSTAALLELSFLHRLGHRCRLVFLVLLVDFLVRTFQVLFESSRVQLNRQNKSQYYGKDCVKFHSYIEVESSVDAVLAFGSIICLVDLEQFINWTSLLILNARHDEQQVRTRQLFDLH